MADSRPAIPFLCLLVALCVSSSPPCQIQMNRQSSNYAYLRTHPISGVQITIMYVVHVDQHEPARLHKTKI